jgi:hypothetical protein
MRHTRELRAPARFTVHQVDDKRELLMELYVRDIAIVGKMCKFV